MSNDIMTRLTDIAFYRHNAKLIAGTLLFVWGWMLMYGVLFYTPSYTAESLVMIKDSAITSGYVEVEQSYSTHTTSSNAANPVLNTMGLLKSATIMDRLWDYFYTQHPEELQKLKIDDKKEWEAFFKDGSHLISAKNKPGTDLIQVKVSWSDPAIAKEAGEIVLTAFQDASLDINQSEQLKRRQYLENQVKDLARQTEAVRRKKSEYKQMAKTVDIAQQRTELTKARVEFESKLNMTLAKADGKRAELARYQKTMGLSPDQALTASAIGMNTTLTKLKNQLYTLSQTHAFLSTTLTDENPKVKEVKAKMDQVEANIRQELKRTLGNDKNLDSLMAVADSSRNTVVGQMVSAQAELIRLNQQAKSLENRLSDIAIEIQAFPTVEEGLAAIEQEERTLSESLDSLRKKAMESRLREAQTLSNVFIVDLPRVPNKADFPTYLHLVVIAVVMGIGAAAGAVCLRYKWDEYQSKTIQQVEYQTAQTSQEVLNQDNDVLLDDLFAVNKVLAGMRQGQPENLLPEPVRQPAQQPEASVTCENDSVEETLDSLSELISALDDEITRKVTGQEKNMNETVQPEPVHTIEDTVEIAEPVSTNTSQIPPNELKNQMAMELKLVMATANKLNTPKAEPIELAKPAKEVERFSQPTVIRNMMSRRLQQHQLYPRGFAYKTV
ncbi:MAG: hypothetical protein KTR14_04955 [Vampirovibrio sp.]|nr:hypothetical protein [Vampirovibrio sp.]